MADDELGLARQNPSPRVNLYKLSVMHVILFLSFLLPFIWSRPPEFINQLLETRARELLHLVFVGIAFTYGVFGKKHDAEEKENDQASTLDNAQLYFSSLLQVSAIFSDDTLGPSAAICGNNIQRWSNQHDSNFHCSAVGEEEEEEEELLSPKRSSKSCVFDAAIDQSRRSADCQDFGVELKNDIVNPSVPTTNVSSSNWSSWPVRELAQKVPSTKRRSYNPVGDDGICTARDWSSDLDRRMGDVTAKSGNAKGEMDFMEIVEEEERGVEKCERESAKEDDPESYSKSSAAVFSMIGDAGSSGGGDGAQDVNKKADEFIAKFREQINLQRMECTNMTRSR